MLRRDGICVAWRLASRGLIRHACRDAAGRPQLPDHELTMEHVKDEPGGPRIHDRWHMVACCHFGNVLEHVASAHAPLFRAHLAEVEP